MKPTLLTLKKISDWKPLLPPLTKSNFRVQNLACQVFKVTLQNYHLKKKNKLLYSVVVAELGFAISSCEQKSTKLTSPLLDEFADLRKVNYRARMSEVECCTL